MLAKYTAKISGINSIKTGVGYAECKENRRDMRLIDFAQNYIENKR